MKRRAFCASALAITSLQALPWRQALGNTVETPAVRGDGRPILLKGPDIADLRASLRGELLQPGQPGYDEARRIWNGAFDRRPALIARCAGAADVSRAVQFARANELLVAVRGGGHSFSGQSVCAGGLMIDLSRMRGIRVDPIARRARVEPGVLLGELDRESQFFGLATPAGTVSHTGAAGLTLGGGFGRLGRRFGLACDNLCAADVVTANGRFVRTSENENADLLWGLKGGGGNLGVVTSFEYQLHPVDPRVFGGSMLFPFDQAKEILSFFSGFAAEAPEELYSDAALIVLPDVGPALAFNICYSGPPEKAEQVLKPLRSFRKPLRDALGPTTYVAVQAGNDAQWPAGKGYYERSGFLRRVEPGLIDAVIDRIETPLTGGQRSPGVSIAIVHQGGAISRVDRTATAFWHREPLHTVIAHADWPDPKDRASAEAHMQWARDTFRAVEPFTQGFYVNTVALDDPHQRIRATYGDNYARLVSLKDKYDPTNLFRMNANVPPSRPA